jgi:signal transduction histidine kinase
MADIGLFNKHDKSLKISYHPQDIIVEADKARISQVISNLLSNATKFTKEGSIIITTAVDVDSGNDGKINMVIVSVKDTGTGIDPEILPRLFSKFVTKSDKGTGLGLYISKSIIESHGGRIWAENNEGGKGAIFYFSLPILVDQSQEK